MSDETTETTSTETKRESLGETLSRLTAPPEDDATEQDAPATPQHRFGLSLAVFPTADVPSQNAITKPVQLEQSGPGKLAVGQHKRIKTWIGKRSKRGGPREPQAGTPIES